MDASGVGSSELLEPKPLPEDPARRDGAADYEGEGAAPGTEDEAGALLAESSAG